MQHPFQYGQQVWTRYDDDWWPAKVIAPELAGLPDDGSLVIQFYSEGGEICQFEYNPELVVPFEASSEKAVTGNPDIQVAIQRAQNDDTAVAATSTVAQTSYAAAGKSRAARTTAGTTTGRRGRAGAAVQQEAPANSAGDLNNVNTEVSDAELLQYCEELQTAIQSGDISSLRRILLRLARVKPSFRQLQNTKVGVKVGAILQESRLTQLQPIVSCILRCWMQELPEATKDALRRYAARATGAGLSVLYGESEQEAATSGAAANNAEGGEQQQQQQNQNVQQQQQSSRAAPTATAGSTADAKLPPGLSDFGIKLARRFVGFNSNGQATPENIISFCNKVDSSVHAPDQRIKLLSEISKESHSKLRGELLSGQISVEKFMAMSKEELLSPEEIAMQQEHKEAIEFRAAEGKKELVGNPLFECPECNMRNSTQYEVQIRSSDEPATVFINCLECGHNWREG